MECPNCDRMFKARACPTCGWEPPRATTTPAWVAPTYPALSPEDDAQIRAARAALHAAPWWRAVAHERPDVDPSLRAALDARMRDSPARVGDAEWRAWVYAAHPDDRVKPGKRATPVARILGRVLNRVTPGAGPA